jgi:hypothetical protein
MIEKFTTSHLENVPNTGRGQKIYLDKIPPLEAVKGQLGLKVGKYSKTFFVRYKINGTLKQYSLGRFPDHSLANAKKGAVETLLQVDRGIDPNSTDDSEKEHLFKDLWKPYMEKVERDDKKKTAAGRRPMSEQSKREQD